jgi:hypothetical protein
MSIERVILLYASSYDFVPTAGDGSRLKGLKLQYITDYIEHTENAQGTPIMMATAPLEAKSGLAAVPGVYEVDFRMRPGKDNKPTLTPVSLAFVSPWTPGAGVVEIEETAAPSAAGLNVRTRNGSATISLPATAPEPVGAGNGTNG